MRVILKPAGVGLLLTGIALLVVVSLRPWQSMASTPPVAQGRSLPAPVASTSPEKEAASPVSVLKNGDFEANGGNPTGALDWEHIGEGDGKPIAQVERDPAQGRCVVVTKTEEKQYGGFSQDIALDPNWRTLRLTARLKTRGIVAGKEQWQRAGVLTPLVDEKNNIVDYREAIHLTDAPNWQVFTADIQIPEKTKANRLRLSPGVYGPKGTLYVDDVTVTVLK